MYRNSMKKHVVIIALMIGLGLAIIFITVISSPKRRMQNAQPAAQEKSSTVKEKKVKGEQPFIPSAPQNQVVVNKSPTPQPPEDLDDTSTVESEKKLPASEASLPEMDKQQLIKKLTEEAKNLVRGKVVNWITPKEESQFQDLMTRLELLGQNTDTLWRIHDLYKRDYILFHSDPDHTADDFERKRIEAEIDAVHRELAALGEPFLGNIYTDPVTGKILDWEAFESAPPGWPFNE